MERGVFDESVGNDLAAARGVHQRHFPWRQLYAVPTLAQLRMAAALDDQEAVAVVVMIGMGGLAGDAPCVGADLRQLQTAKVLPRDIADEQRPVQRGLRFEAPADLAQRLVPGFEAVVCGRQGMHRAPPDGNGHRYCCMARQLPSHAALPL